MSWTITADPDEFPEASAWFRSRIAVTREMADKLGDYAGPRAWTIAGVLQLHVVQDTFDAIAAAIQDGRPYREWVAEVEQKLTAAWGRKDSHAMLTMFRNATAQAHNAGRWQQIQETRLERPYLLFDGVDDSRQTPICRSWDGFIAHIDVYPAEGHPQMHHACRSRLRSIRESTARAMGISAELPELAPATGFGKAPDGAEWQPDPAKFWSELFAEYKVKRDDLRKRARRPRIDEE